STLKDYGCGYFIWKDKLRLRLFGKKNYIDKEFMPSFYLEPSTPPSSSSGHVGFAPNLGMSKCSSCKILALKIKILEAKIDIERHLKDHTCIDIAKILRKRSKSDNHGHENGIEYTRARRILSKVCTLVPNSYLHNQQHQAPPPVVEPFNLEEPFENPPPPPPPMDEQSYHGLLLEAPTEGYEDAM
ncbi:hypothetical protein Tco_0097199, partial [Tanacetum coccineum]